MPDAAPQLGRAVVVRDVLEYAKASCRTCFGTGYFTKIRLAAFKGDDDHRDPRVCGCAMRRFEKACAGRYVPGRPDRWIVSAEPENWAFTQMFLASLERYRWEERMRRRAA